MDQRFAIQVPENGPEQINNIRQQRLAGRLRAVEAEHRLLPWMRSRAALQVLEPTADALAKHVGARGRPLRELDGKSARSLKGGDAPVPPELLAPLQFRGCSEHRHSSRPPSWPLAW